METVHNLEKTKRTISIVAGFSRNTKQSINEKLNLIPVDIQKADKCAKIAKTDTGKGLYPPKNVFLRDVYFGHFFLISPPTQGAGGSKFQHRAFSNLPFCLKK